MSDSITFSGSDGVAQPGESPASAPTPYTGTPTIKASSSSGLKDGMSVFEATQQVSQGNPSPTQASNSEEPANSTAQNTNSPSGTPSLPEGTGNSSSVRAALEARGYDFSSYEDDETLVEDIASVLSNRDKLLAEEELEEFKKYKQNFPAYQNYLASLANGNSGSSGDREGGAEGVPSASPSASQEGNHEPAQSLMIDIEPLVFEDRPKVDPQVDSYISSGDIVRRSDGLYEPSEKNQSSAMAIAAANQKNAEVQYEFQIINEFRRDPIGFIERAAASVVNRGLKLVEDRIAPTQEAINSFQKQQVESGTQDFLQQNSHYFFEFDDSGQVKVDAKTGRPKQTQIGDQFGALNESLADKIPDDNERYRVVMKSLEPLIAAMQSAQQPASPPAVNGGGNAQAAAPPAEQAPNGDEKPNGRNRRLTLAKKAAESNQRRSVETANVPGRTPAPAQLRRSSMPSLRSYVQN